MSGMTDEVALEIVCDNLLPHTAESPLDQAVRYIAARLRGEAQAEQAVACTVRKDTGLTVTADRLPQYMGVRLPTGTKLYTRPQPAAVAGDAVRALVERWRPHGRVPLCELEAALSSTAAPALSRVDPAVSAQLSEDVAREQATAAEIDALCAPAPVAGDAVALDAVEIYRIWFESNAAWHQMLPPKPDRNYHFAKAIEAHVIAALAQDRASQSLPSPVPGDQVGDIVARWMEKKLTAEQAMLVIKRHLDHCYMQPANDYNRGWVAGANSVTERAAELVEAAERASQAAPVAVPSGWRLVPVQATAAMLAQFEGDRGAKITDGRVYAGGLWNAMIAAAPSPAAEREVDRG